MVNSILFWSSFGIATRLLQLGIQMLPLTTKRGVGVWGYPIFGGIGGMFGYWMEDMGRTQKLVINQRRETLLAKRARRAERERAAAEAGEGAAATH